MNRQVKKRDVMEYKNGSKEEGKRRITRGGPKRKCLPEIAWKTV